MAWRNVLVQGGTRGIGRALVEQLLANPDVAQVFATGRPPLPGPQPRLTWLPLELTDEGTIEATAAAVAQRTDRLHLVMNVAGILHDEGRGMAPEKKLEQLEAEHLAHAFAVHATGPALVAKHLLPLLSHDERVVLANLSARVGSIGDNRRGGWYAYRASKAAQNMITKTLSIELRRRAERVICVALHPGTVDTDLSRPFQRSVPDHQLFDRERAARQLLAICDGLESSDSGSFIAWDGAPIPW